MIVEHEAGQSLQGLSGVGNVCVGRDIPDLRALFCGYVNLNGILCNQEHPLINQQGSLCSFPPSTISSSLFFLGLWIFYE